MQTKKNLMDFNLTEANVTEERFNTCARAKMALIANDWYIIIT